MILGYSVISWLALGIAIVAIESPECLKRNSTCTPQERLLDNVFGLLFVGALAAYMILGWTGRLLGARRTHPIAPTKPADAA